MSLRQQAKIIEVSAPYLSQMINGKRPWNADVKARYEALAASTFANTQQKSYLHRHLNGWESFGALTNRIGEIYMHYVRNLAGGAMKIKQVRASVHAAREVRVEDGIVSEDCVRRGR